MPRLLCLGVGFSARTLIRRLLPQGWTVAGTSRSSDTCDQLCQQHGLDAAWVFDGTSPLPEAAWEGVTHVLSSIPPSAAAPGGGLDEPAVGLHRPFLQSPALQWIGYLSSTSVYGDRQGGWVDEETPVAPDVPRAVRRVQAEQAWLSLSPAAHIFRLAGIYGPGRNALTQVTNGTARRVIKPGQWFCRIHVEDIATVLQASMAAPNPGRIYNVCDDLPAPPEDPVVYAAELLGIDPPPAIPWEQAVLPEMVRGFYQDSRRVHNRRIHDELGVHLAYPDYREGLAGLLS